jgi:muramoyltetrapeptide carboxypeptidase
MPAHQVRNQAYQEALLCLRSLGVENYHQCFSPQALAQPEQVIGLAGSDRERAHWLEEAAESGGLLWVVRGGFGASRLLPLLDWSKWLQRRPCLLGFSDITVFLLHLAGLGLVSLHGPTLTQLPYLAQSSRDDLAALLAGAELWPREFSGTVVVGGQAQGPLLGGNLCMLCHLLGTPYEPRLEGAILFLEETNEEAYNLDRYLTKLELAGIPNEIAAVALGGLWGYHEKTDAAKIERRRETVLQRLSAWGKPVLADLPFGHGENNRLLPVGATAAVSDNKLTVGILCGRL